MTDIIVNQGDTDEIHVSIEEAPSIEVTIEEKQDIAVTIEEAQNIEVTLESGMFTVKDHGSLENRDAEEQHPISAITDLQSELDDIQTDISTNTTNIQSKQDLIKLADKYSDEDSMIADQSNQLEGQLYQAGDDFYLYNGVATEELEDYSQVGSSDGISGSFNIPLYFTTNASSEVPGYYDLDYTLQAAEVEVENIVSASTSPLVGQSFLYPEEIGIEEINAGIWDFQADVKVSSTRGTTTIGCMVYLRKTDDSEVLLFETESLSIDSIDYTRIDFSSSQPAFSCDTTDKILVKAVVSTTRTPNTTVTAKIGGSDSAYLTTPLSMRHDQLRDVLQAGTGVLEGHISNVAQSIAGVKTFSSSPIVPTPTTDFQTATKKYVDDNSGGGSGGASYSVDGGIISNNATTPDSIIDISQLYDTLSSDRTKTLAVEADTLDITLDASWAGGAVPPTAKDQFPAMTGNSAPTGENAYATSQYSTSFSPYLAFNKVADTNNAWAASNGVFTGTLLRDYTSVYESDIMLLQPRSINENYPEDFTVVYTTDNMSSYTPGVDASITGISFSTVLTVTGNSQTYDELKEFKLDNPVPSNATAVGIIITSAGTGTTNFVSVGRLEFYNSMAAEFGIHVFTDYNSGTQKFILDDNATGSNISGAKRRVDSFITDSSGDIIPFSKKELAGGGIRTQYLTSITDNSSEISALTLIDVSVPKGIMATGDFQGYFSNGDQSSTIYISDYYDIAGTRAYVDNEYAGTTVLNAEVEVGNDSQIVYSSTGYYGPGTLKTKGYTDERTI